MKVRLTDTFKKDYRRLPKNIQAKADRQLRLLMENPKHPSLKVHRIEGAHGFWEFYVDRSYQCVYTLEEDVAVLRYIGPHNIIEKV